MLYSNITDDEGRIATAIERIRLLIKSPLYIIVLVVLGIFINPLSYEIMSYDQVLMHSLTDTYLRWYFIVPMIFATVVFYYNSRLYSKIIENIESRADYSDSRPLFKITKITSALLFVIFGLFCSFIRDSHALWLLIYLCGNRLIDIVEIIRVEKMLYDPDYVDSKRQIVVATGKRAKIMYNYSLMLFLVVFAVSLLFVFDFSKHGYVDRDVKKYATKYVNEKYRRLGPEFERIYITNNLGEWTYIVSFTNNDGTTMKVRLDKDYKVTGDTYQRRYINSEDLLYAFTDRYTRYATGVFDGHGITSGQKYTSGVFAGCYIDLKADLSAFSTSGEFYSVDLDADDDYYADVVRRFGMIKLSVNNFDARPEDVLAWAEKIKNIAREEQLVFNRLEIKATGAYNCSVTLSENDLTRDDFGKWVKGRLGL